MVGGCRSGRKSQASVTKGSSRAHKIAGRVPYRKRLASAAERRAEKRILDMFAEAPGWKKKRSSIIADRIIKICAEEGVAIKDVKWDFLRRISDVPTLQAIDKRLKFLGKKQK